MADEVEWEGNSKVRDSSSRTVLIDYVVGVPPYQIEASHRSHVSVCTSDYV